jgi:ABC-type glycerol-3-phosphate transport system substrate-binding protein
MLVTLATVMFAIALPNTSVAQQKKLVLLDPLDQNPDFNKWYADKGKEFAKKSGYEVEVVTIPYQGYEAKYLAALMAKSSAPDIFMGMTHHWCGQYDFCDKMPADLAKTYDENLPKYMAEVGKWKGVRYGIPSSTATSSRCTSTSTCSRRPASIRTIRPRPSTNGWRT